jgi:SPP1 family predicted phage head-tail adaptor
MGGAGLKAGELRHRVSFQSKTGTPVPDGYGGSAVPWVDFATNIAASIVPTTGRELLAAQAVQNESRFTITTRYVAGIIPAMRIVFGTRVFNILDTSNLDERNKELQFSCSEGLTQG